MGIIKFGNTHSIDDYILHFKNVCMYKQKNLKFQIIYLFIIFKMYQHINA